MKKLYLFSILLLIACTSQINGQHPDSPELEFKDPHGMFKINFIHTPTKYQTKDWPVETIYQDSGQAEISNILYSISYRDYENGMYHSDSINNIEFDIQYSQKKIMQKYSLELMRPPFQTSILGYPGAEFRYKTYDGTKAVRVKVFIVKNRLYILKVETLMQNNFNKGINKFMDSFELLNLKENEKPYLNLPSKEELKNKPYTIKFPTKSENTQTRVIPFQFASEKHAFIMEMVQTDTEILEQEQNLLYGVGFVNLPKGQDITEEAFNAILIDLKKIQTAGYSETVLLKENSIKTDKAIGAELLVELTMMGIRMEMYTQLLYFKNTCFQIQVMTPKKYSSNPKIKEFINSFKVNK